MITMRDLAWLAVCAATTVAVGMCGAGSRHPQVPRYDQCEYSMDRYGGAQILCPAPRGRPEAGPRDVLTAEDTGAP